MAQKTYVAVATPSVPFIEASAARHHGHGRYPRRCTVDNHGPGPQDTEQDGVKTEFLRCVRRMQEMWLWLDVQLKSGWGDESGDPRKKCF